MDAVLFWIMAAIAVAASVLVVGQRHPMYSVLLLLVSFAALAGLYVLLDAPFVATIQIIIYAGAIIILFLFVVMLLNVQTDDPVAAGRLRLVLGAGPRRFGAVLSAALVVELAWVLGRMRSMPIEPAPAFTVRDIGLKLFADYAFAFEATSVLILVAMVGAIILAGKEPS